MSKKPSSCCSVKQTVRTGSLRLFPPYDLHSSLHIREKSQPWWFYEPKLFGRNYLFVFCYTTTPFVNLLLKTSINNIKIAKRKL